MRLISKVQFKRSEKGEFHEIAERNVSETISLLLSYPWDRERSLAPVELTCPSVTIEHPIGTYLKIGPYFSGKFSLYYFGVNNKVYLKIADTLDDAVAYIKTYFEQEGKLTGFEKYGFIINPAAHFKTNSFEYLVDAKRLFAFFTFPIFMSGIVFLLCLLRFFDRPGNFNFIEPTAFVFLFTLLVSSPFAYLFFNYLSVDRNCYLQISKGHRDFLFGTREDKKLYSKENIVEVKTYQTPNSRSPWSECEIFILTFNNGEEIRFTSLLISRTNLIKKLPNLQLTYIKRFFATVEGV